MHLVCGLPCSGKTTLARALEQERHALRLCPDEWIARVFGEAISGAALDATRDPVEAALWELAVRLLGLGVDVIIENGFWSRSEREAYRLRATRLGARSEIHYTHADRTELLRRLAARNADLPWGTFRIDERQLLSWWDLFEAPDDEELRPRDNEGAPEQHESAARGAEVAVESGATKSTRSGPMTQEARLVELDHGLRNAFVELADEFARAGESRYVSALEDFDGYVSRLHASSRGEDPRPGRVPETTYWLFADGRILGRGALRHELTPEIEREGGHIGYDVRPRARGRGWGTKILELLLEKARARGLERVRLTCDAENAASARVIERNGGHLAGRTTSLKSGQEILQYWIDTGRRR